jgi:ATP-dependent Lon protease
MIRLTDFTIDEKVKIAREYLLPGIFRELDDSVKENCKFTDEMLKYIFTNYCREHNNGGVRKYKELLTGIVNKVNMLSLVNCSEKVLKLLQIKEKITLPIVFESRSLVDRFLLSKSADLPDNPPEGMYS